VTEREARVAESIERVARESYGRLLAALSVRTKDIAACEDALSSAFTAALRRWPETGVPDAPEGWILSAARNALTDAFRHDTVVRNSREAVTRAIEERASSAPEGSLRDDRLTLMFVCAHPAIDEYLRPALILQTVVGFTAAEIATLYLTSPGALEKRLTRAKAKIRDAGIPFAIPGPEQLPARLQAVLEAIYGAFTAGLRSEGPAIPVTDDRCAEALFLARLVSEELPQEPEALGLRSLVAFCAARRNAGRSTDGTYVPLDEQDIERWNTSLIHEAEAALGRAVGYGVFGRFQLEAAIQSAHTARLYHGADTAHALTALYDALVERYPTIGARVARCGALARSSGPTAALEALAAIPAAEAAGYQPYWATRADLLHREGRFEEAIADYDRAVGMTSDGAVRRYLLERRHEAEDRKSRQSIR
jgi:RNA polymerase sigma-70 factor, ECF subfamily